MSSAAESLPAEKLLLLLPFSENQNPFPTTHTLETGYFHIEQKKNTSVVEKEVDIHYISQPEFWKYQMYCCFILNPLFHVLSCTVTASC